MKTVNANMTILSELNTLKFLQDRNVGMHKIELLKSPATEEHNLQPEAVILVKSGHLSHLTPIPIRKFIILLILCNLNKRAFK